MRLFADAEYPFLSWRVRAYVVSAIALVGGLIAMFINVATLGSWLNYGVDFSGGTMVQVDFAGDVQVEDVRAVNSEWELSRFGELEESAFIIQVPSFEEDLTTDPAADVSAALTSAFGEGSFEIARTYAVGPSVGRELQQRALFAILISFALTLIYLAFRFEWRFGVAAIIATAHDILIALGLIAALRMEISVSTIAAFLTIVGYSLNDTIVIFDRIRENIGKKKRGETFAALIDRSVNETLPRTVLTSGTTLATLGALYIFGGAVIRDFAMVLILGIAIGTFSSIFVASPALFTIERKWPRTAKKTGRPGSNSRREAARA